MDDDHVWDKAADQLRVCWCGEIHPWYLAHWRPQVLVLGDDGKVRLLPATAEDAAAWRKPRGRT